MEKKHMGLLLAVLIIQASFHLLLLNSPFFHTDEGFYLSSAWLFTKGKLVITDFFDMHPPAFSLFGGILFSFFGSSPVTARLAIAVLQLSTTIVLFLLGKSVLDEKRGLLLASIYAMTEISFGGFRFLADSALVLLAAFSVLALVEFMKSNRRRDLLLAGLFIGLMLAIRQTSIYHLLALLAFLLVLDKRKEAFLMFGASLAPPFAIFLYYLSVGAPGQLFYSVFLVPLNLAAKPYPSFEPFMVIYLGLALPALLLLPKLRSLKKIRADRRTQATLLVILWALAGLAGFFPASIFFHLLQPLPAFILLLLSLQSVHLSFSRLLPSLTVLCASLLLFFFALFSLLAVVSGGGFIGEKGPEEFRSLSDYIQSTVPEDESILAYPHFPLYSNVQREPGSYYITFEEFFATNDARQKVLADMELNKPRLFIQSEDLDFAPELESYVASHYEKKKTYYTGVFNVTVFELIR